MSQENLQTMIMQNFWVLKEVYYGIVLVVNSTNLKERDGSYDVHRERVIINAVTRGCVRNWSSITQRRHFSP